MLVILGSYAMITNYNTGDCANEFANCPVTFVNSVSISSIILHPEKYYYQTWVNFGTIILIMLSMHYFRKMQKLTENECDRGLVSPSDYAIWIKNLPKGEFNKKDIESIFHEKFGFSGNIEKIIFSYNISVFVDLCNKSNQIEQKILKGKAYEATHGKWPEGSTLVELESEQEIIENNLEEFIKKTEDPEKSGLLQETTGDVFVIFSHQQGNQFFRFYFKRKR